MTAPDDAPRGGEGRAAAKIAAGLEAAIAGHYKVVRAAQPAAGPALEEMAERLRGSLRALDGLALLESDARELLADTLTGLPPGSERDAALASILARLEPRPAPDLPAASFQARNAAWMAEVFVGDPTDTAERVNRFSEEALELGQSLGQTVAEAHALVDYVHGRPAGDPAQEVGGTMTTLALLCSHVGIDMAAAGEAELARCSTPAIVAKIREKRSKRHGRGPLPGTYAPDFVPAPDLPAQEEARDDGWRPMETAPRDGTSILTVDADGGMYVVDWDETLGNGVPVTSGHCWWGTEGSGKYGFHTSTFVAWRPLPAPPSDGRA